MKHILRTRQTTALRLAALWVCVCVFLCTALCCAHAFAPDGAAQTTLLIYIDSEANEPAAAFLIADRVSGDGPAVLPVPVTSRAMVDRYTADGTRAHTVYAPLYEAYIYGGATDAAKAGNMALAVSGLLYGISIDRTAVLDSETLAEVIDASGGLRMNMADLPPLSMTSLYITSPTYPSAGDTGGTATWLKQRMDAAGAVEGYDMDAGRAMYSAASAALASTDASTVLLDGDAVTAVAAYSVFGAYGGTDIMQIRRQGYLLEAYMVLAASGLPYTSYDGFDFILRDEGESVFLHLTAPEGNSVRGCVEFPIGSDRIIGGQTCWVFDSTWLHAWVETNVLGLAG